MQHAMPLEDSADRAQKQRKIALVRIPRVKSGFWLHEVAHDYMRTSGSQPSSIARSSAGVGQKPSWFNNAGHTGTFAQKGGSQPSVRENVANTRQRYTVLTLWLTDDA